MAINKPNVLSKRIALVIGNSKYEFATPLKNPTSDAEEISKALNKLRFEVITKTNLDLRNFKNLIRDFGSKIIGYEVVLFFFAGHGLQVNGTNYLIPVDANPNSENQVDFECINANWVLSLIEDGTADVNIVVLDACRNNPFKRSWHRAPTREGLSFLSAPKGTLIAYSTAPDKTASDGLGNNSPYSTALVEEIINPAVNVNQLFQVVRTRVIKATSGVQIPWESTSLLNDFHFNNGEFISIETFCSGLIYNNEYDRVLNSLLLNILDFQWIKKLKLKIEDVDKNAGVIEVFVKRSIKVFSIFETIEFKLYKDGMREYIFFVAGFRDENAVFNLANAIYRKLGVGLYDDGTHRSFTDFDAVKKIAKRKVNGRKDECFTLWSFGRISFLLQYLTDPSCLFILRVKFTPERKVIPQSILNHLRFDIQDALIKSVEIDREIRDGEIHHIDYFFHLSIPEFKIFDSLTIRVFGSEKIYHNSNSMNVFLSADNYQLKANELGEIIATLTSIYGKDKSGNGYLEGTEIDDIKANRYWSGRWWDFNLQHQLLDSDSDSEMHLYTVHLTYDSEEKKLELAIIGFNSLVEKFS